MTTKLPNERLLQAALRVLQFHSFRAKEANKWAAELVGEARSDGVSWENVALQLGVRRQTAWERYRVGEKPMSSTRPPDEPKLINYVDGASISPADGPRAPR